MYYVMQSIAYSTASLILYEDRSMRTGYVLPMYICLLHMFELKHVDILANHWSAQRGNRRYSTTVSKALEDMIPVPVQYVRRHSLDQAIVSYSTHTSHFTMIIFIKINAMSQ